MEGELDPGFHRTTGADRASQDRATGIAPFITPLPAATAPTPLPIRILLAPITYVIGGARTAAVVLILLVHFLLVEALLKICVSSCWSQRRGRN